MANRGTKGQFVLRKQPGNKTAIYLNNAFAGWLKYDSEVKQWRANTGEIALVNLTPSGDSVGYQPNILRRFYGDTALGKSRIEVISKLVADDFEETFKRINNDN